MLSPESPVNVSRSVLGAARAPLRLRVSTPPLDKAANFITLYRLVLDGGGENGLPPGLRWPVNTQPDFLYMVLAHSSSRRQLELERVTPIEPHSLVKIIELY